VVTLYRRFGTAYRSHLQRPIRLPFLDVLPVKMGPIRRPETSVKDYHSTLCYTPEERISHQHRGRNLKSGIFTIFRFIIHLIYCTIV
jgi:hypothetical protein